MRIRGYFQFANLRLHYIGFHKASFKCILTGKIPLKQWTMKISQFASKIASQQSVEQLHYWHFKQLDQTLLSDFGSLQRFQLIKFSLIRWWHKPHASPHPSKSCDHVMQVWVWTKRRDTTQMWETLMSMYIQKQVWGEQIFSKQTERTRLAEYCSIAYYDSTHPHSFRNSLCTHGCRSNLRCGGEKNESWARARTHARPSSSAFDWLLNGRIDVK